MKRKRFHVLRHLTGENLLFLVAFYGIGWAFCKILGQDGFKGVVILTCILGALALVAFLYCSAKNSAPPLTPEAQRQQDAEDDDYIHCHSTTNQGSSSYQLYDPSSGSNCDPSSDDPFNGGH